MLRRRHYLLDRSRNLKMCRTEKRQLSQEKREVKYKNRDVYLICTHIKSADPCERVCQTHRCLRLELSIDHEKERTGLLWPDGEFRDRNGGVSGRNRSGVDALVGLELDCRERHRSQNNP
jgi:hypothetical protein